MRDPFVTVVSSRRPHNVPLMLGHLDGVEHTWIVPAGQEEDYRYTGAPHVVGVASTQLSHQLNFALRIGGIDRYTICMDDDLKRLHWTHPGSNSKRPIGIADAVAALVDACERLDAYYAGVQPTDNAYFTRQMFNAAGFIRSAFIAVRPGSELMFDDNLRLRADYDYTLQHLTKYGRVARVDSLLASFDYGTGPGGANDYRTPELIQESIDYLMRKWPDNIAPHPTRAGEVRLRWKGTDGIARLNEAARPTEATMEMF